MTRRIVIIDAGVSAASIAAKLEALELATISTVKAFREMAEQMHVIEQVAAPRLPPAPRFGNDRPYLKRKKGRP